MARPLTEREKYAERPRRADVAVELAEVRPAKIGHNTALMLRNEKRR